MELKEDPPTKLQILGDQMRFRNGTQTGLSNNTPSTRPPNEIQKWNSNRSQNNNKNTVIMGRYPNGYYDSNIT